jgi:hypothetical protein
MVDTEVLSVWMYDAKISDVVENIPEKHIRPIRGEGVITEEDGSTDK